MRRVVPTVFLRLASMYWWTGPVDVSTPPSLGHDVLGMKMRGSGNYRVA